MILEIIVGLITLFIGIYILLWISKINNWEKNYGIPGTPYGGMCGTVPSPFHWDIICGRESQPTLTRKLGDQYQEHKIWGAYGMSGFPMIIINDPELVKDVLVKHFDSFGDRIHEDGLKFLFFNNSLTDQIWRNSLLFLPGQEWKDLRASVSPLFTGKKMKYMMRIMDVVSDKFIGVIKNHPQRSDLNIEELVQALSMDTIANSVFGIDPESIVNGGRNEFMKNGANVFNLGLKERLKIMIFLIPIIGILIFKCTNWSLIFRNQETEYVYKVLVDNLEHRKRNPEFRRGDMLDLMLDRLKGQLDDEETEDPEAKSTSKKQVSEISLISTACVFLNAGYDSIALTFLYIFYELSRHPDVVRDLRNEIHEKLGDGDIDYEDLMSIELLDMIIFETLRLHTFNNTPRAVLKDFKFPGMKRPVKKGEMVIINAWSIHHNPEIYPEPKKWDPYRFTKEKMETRHKFSFLGFSQGPRICIGMRFAMLQLKLTIVKTLRNFDIKPTSNTPDKIELDPKSAFGYPKQKILLNFVPI